MIDPITAFSAVSSAATAISKAVKAGRDLNSLGHQIAKYATAEADLQFGESNKKKSKFSFTEDVAIERHFKKEELKQKRDELRSLFLLYGAPGQWERLQAEIASVRKERADYLKKLAKQKRDRLNAMLIIIGVLFAVGAIALEIWFLKTL